MPEGVRVQYQEELERLEASALDGLNLVTAALDRTLEAVEHQDVELAQIVVADDDRIDGRYLEVHQSLITLLATQSPVATDLRLISALLHVLKNIFTMGKQVRSLITQVKRAFAARDVDLARDLVRQDDVVDN
ncbi:MAG TPA: PhoU domain-containing protein, partial [Solirubrobacterales bacterium]|nr:PhoU domain-containing protein [Solirubrobacterales bacterium]